MEELKDRLALALKIRNVKAADIARDLDIPKGAISQYLSGKVKNMDGERFFKIANYLYVDYAWLLGYDVPMNNKEVINSNEEFLISTFRRLNADGKNRMIEYANMLLNCGYKEEQ